MRHGENKYVVKLWMGIIPCVFLCHHGMRSMQATYYLYQLGFQNVKSLSGGIDHWAIEINLTLNRY